MKVQFTMLALALATSCVFTETAISPVISQDPFLTKFQSIESLLPVLMVYPSPSGTGFQGSTAAFQFNTTSSPLIAVNPNGSGSMVAAMNQDPCWQSNMASMTNTIIYGVHHQEIAIASSSDQGDSWTHCNIPLHIALGGGVSNSFQLAALQYSGTGNSIYMAGRFADVGAGWEIVSQTPNHIVPLSGIWVSYSQDGKAWTSQTISHKNSDAGMVWGVSDGTPDLSCDPMLSNSAFVAWNRIGHAFHEQWFVKPYLEIGYPPTYGDIYFSQTQNQAASWSRPKKIYNLKRDTGKRGRAAGVSLLATSLAPTGPLLIASFMRYLPNVRHTDRVCIRSTDSGKSWDTSATPVAPFVMAQSYNPSRPFPMQYMMPPYDGSERSRLIVNPSTGTLYLLWQAGSLHTKKRSVAKQHPEMVLSVSLDFGKTWSRPRTISRTYQALLSAKRKPLTTAAYQAFNGNIAVMQNGLVGIVYYDCRNFQDGSEVASTDAWLAVYREMNGSLTFVKEHRLTTDSFDQNLIGLNDTSSIGIGNQLGIASSGDTFVCAYAKPGDKTTPIGPQEGHYAGFLYTANVDLSQQLTCFVKPVQVQLDR